jgi:superfamily II DNA or RNA helicase
LLLQQLIGRTCGICPPVLKEYWKDSLFDFGIRSFEVESLGMLHNILKKGTERYDYIVVDEAHRFRNEGTNAYADLLEICVNKKVILVSATPLNKSINDICSQLKFYYSWSSKSGKIFCRFKNTPKQSG